MTSSNRKGWPPWTRRILVLALSTTLALVLSELAVRVLDLDPPPRPEDTGRDTRRVKDPELRWLNAPNGGRTFTYRDRSGAVARVAKHTINAQGWRGAEVELEKEPGVTRVACVGDSYTFGWGVNDDATWPVAFERALERDHDRPVEALNLGVPGYNVAQQARLIETIVPTFDPDLVLLCWFQNDTELEGRTIPTPRLLRILGSPKVRWLCRYSRLAALIAETLYQREAARSGIRIAIGAESVIVQDTIGSYADNPGWTVARERLTAIQSQLADSGVRFALVLYPTLWESGDALDSHDDYEIVKAFCDSSSIPCFDLEPVFLGSDLESLRVHRFDNHPNGEAHAIAGAAIADFVVAQGLLESE